MRFLLTTLILICVAGCVVKHDPIELVVKDKNKTIDSLKNDNYILTQRIEGLSRWLNDSRDNSLESRWLYKIDSLQSELNKRKEKDFEIYMRIQKELSGGK